MDNTDVLFRENHAAAQSMKNVWTRMASTYGCMMIVLSGKTLTIKPHWFMKWLIIPLGLDLCHEIPVTQIKAVTETGKWSGYGKVEVLFKTPAGEDRKILLYLKKYHDFIDKAENTRMSSVLTGE